jgi:hypothetical protein
MVGCFSLSLRIRNNDYTCDSIPEDYDYDVQDVLGLNVNPVPEKTEKKGHVRAMGHVSVLLLYCSPKSLSS